MSSLLKMRKISSVCGSCELATRADSSFNSSHRRCSLETWEAMLSAGFFSYFNSCKYKFSSLRSLTCSNDACSLSYISFAVMNIIINCCGSSSTQVVIIVIANPFAFLKHFTLASYYVLYWFVASPANRADSVICTRHNSLKFMIL